MKLLSDEKTMYQEYDWLDPEDTVNPQREAWNKQAFEEMRGELSEAQGKIDDAERELASYKDSNEELRETLRGLLIWLTECEERFNREPEFAPKFFIELETEIKSVARNTGFWTRGRLDLSKGS